MNRRHLIPTSITVGTLLTLSTIAVAVAPGTAAGKPAPASPAPAVKAGHGAPRTGSTVTASLAARSAQAERAHAVRSLGELVAAKSASLVADLVEARQGVQGGMWDCIRTAESGNRYEIVSGAYGILISSWQAYSYVWAPYGSWSIPGEAPAAIQDLVAYRLYQAGGGFGGWHNHCTGIS